MTRLVRQSNGLNADVDRAEEKRREAALRWQNKTAAKRRAAVVVTRTGQRTTLRRTPLKPVSDKRRVENRERRAMLREMFPEPENVMCVVPGCCNRADDPHEPLTRGRGGSITDPTNIAPLCRPHHREITDTEPEWAYELGLLRHSWDVA